MIALHAKTPSIWSRRETLWMLFCVVVFTLTTLHKLPGLFSETLNTDAAVVWRPLAAVFLSFLVGALTVVFTFVYLTFRRANARFLAVATRNTLAYQTRGQSAHFVKRRQCVGFARNGMTLILDDDRRIDLDVSQEFEAEANHFFGALLEQWQLKFTAETVRNELERTRPRFWKYTKWFLHTLFLAAVVLLIVVYDNYGALGFLLCLFPLMLILVFAYRHVEEREKKAHKDHWFRLPKPPEGKRRGQPGVTPSPERPTP